MQTWGAPDAGLARFTVVRLPPLVSIGCIGPATPGRGPTSKRRCSEPGSALAITCYATKNRLTPRVDQATLGGGADGDLVQDHVPVSQFPFQARAASSTVVYP